MGREAKGRKGTQSGFRATRDDLKARGVPVIDLLKVVSTLRKNDQGGITISVGNAWSDVVEDHATVQEKARLEQILYEVVEICGHITYRALRARGLPAPSSLGWKSARGEPPH